MTGLLELRLGNQRLKSGANVNSDVQRLLAWMGAVQAQDYVGRRLGACAAHAVA